MNDVRLAFDVVLGSRRINIQVQARRIGQLAYELVESTRHAQLVLSQRFQLLKNEVVIVVFRVVVEWQTRQRECRLVQIEPIQLVQRGRVVAAV